MVQLTTCAASLGTGISCMVVSSADSLLHLAAWAASYMYMLKCLVQTCDVLLLGCQKALPLSIYSCCDCLAAVPPTKAQRDLVVLNIYFL